VAGRRTRTAVAATGPVRVVAKKHPLNEYMELIAALPLRVITTERQLDAANGMIGKLLSSGPISRNAMAYLNVLTILVQQYESIHYPTPTAPDNEVLKYFLEDRGMSQAELVRRTGIAKSTISEIVSGAKQLTRGQMGRIAEALKITPAAFSFPSD